MTGCGFVVGFAWLWGEKRKPCVKQSQNGSVLDLFVAVNERRKSFRRKLHRSKNWTEWNNFVKNYKTELHSSEPDVIQDTACSILDFIHQCGLIFAKYFLFFSAWGMLSSLSWSHLATAVFYLWRGKQSFPLSTTNVFNVQFPGVVRGRSPLT